MTSVLSLVDSLDARIGTVKAGVANSVKVTPRMGRTGIGLTSPNYYIPAFPLINRLKYQDDISQFRGGGGSLNAKGYPTLNANGYCQGGVGIDNYGGQKVTRWQLDYTRTGDIRINAALGQGDVPQATIISDTGDTPGGSASIVFDHTSLSDIGLAQAFFLTYTAVNGGTITDQRLYPISQQGNASFVNLRDLYQAGERFDPDSIAYYSGFGLVRAMDLTATNGNQTSSWADATPEDQMSYATSLAKTGTALSVVCKLANRAGAADLHYCIPAHADDNFVTQALTLIRDTLGPSQVLALEYSNEGFNFTFEQFVYAQQKGLALGQAQNPQQSWGAYEWFGYRSAQIVRIAEQVFANQRHRLINIAPFRGDMVAPAASAIAVSGAGNHLYMYDARCTNYYVDGGLQGSDSNSADNATIVSMAKAGATGEEWALKQMTGEGTALNYNGFSLVSVKANLDSDVINFSEPYGWANWGYEGNYHLSPQDKITSRFGAENVPVMLDFYKRITANQNALDRLWRPLIQYWFKQYGDTIIGFVDYGVTMQSGSWGLKYTVHSTETALPLRTALTEVAFAAPPRPVLAATTMVVKSPKVGDAPVVYIKARGGTLPYRTEVLSGALPAGTNLNGRALRGTYTTAGTYAAVVKLTDRSGQSIQVAVNLTVSA